MKGPSEAEFRKALGATDLSLFVYKPPDDARNRKPCDFMVWIGHAGSRASSAWFEVKETDHVNTFPRSEIRAAQLLGIREARRLGIPYWLAIYWRRHRSWTIVDAVKLLDAESYATEVDGQKVYLGVSRVWQRTTLMSRFGVESTTHQLASNLKQVILGEAD